MNYSPQPPIPEQTSFEPWGFLMRRKSLVVVIAALAALAALAYSVAVANEEYSAESRVLTTAPRLEERVLEFRAVPSIDLVAQQATELAIASSDLVADKAARAVDDNSKADVEITREATSNVLNFTATGPDPDDVADLANATAESYVTVQEGFNSAALDIARDQLSSDLSQLPADAGSEAEALQKQIARLDSLGSLQAGSVQMAETAEAPTDPEVGAKAAIVRNTLLGGILGLALGIGLALFADRTDRRLKGLKELQESFGLPLLGTIPEDKALTGATDGLDALSGGTAEAFRLLRSHLRYFGGRADPVRSVLITSPSPGDGKTTTAYHLALASAEAGERTLLVDANLQVGSADAAGSPGLADVLANQSSLAEVVSGSASPRENLDFLPSGGTPSTPALLEGARAREVFESAAGEYDLVVVDGPPLTLSAGAVALVGLLDASLVVGRVGATEGDAVNDLRSQLTELGESPLGVVANAVPPRAARRVTSTGPSTLSRLLRS